MGLGRDRGRWGEMRLSGASRRMQRSVARLGVGCLLLIGMMCAAPAVAASGTSTAPSTPAATEPASPPTTAPPSGTNGLLAGPSGTPDPTPRTTPTADPTATAAVPAIPSSLQSVPVTPTGTTPATQTPATQAPPSPTPQSPTATATSLTSSPTPTNSPTPTGAPTGMPGANAVSPGLANLVILDNPGTGGNASVARIAVRHYGEQVRPDGVPWVGWCEMFAENVLSEAGIPQPRYATAIADAVSAPLYRGRAPAGSLVFFDQRADPNGHVGVSLGDGTMLSALGSGIVRSAYESWPSYLGWRPYGTTAPQDDSFIATPLLFPPTSDEVHLSEMPPWPDQRNWYAPPPYTTPQSALK
jgi:hypothetical protein